MVLIKLVVCNRCSLESHGLLLLFVLSFVVVIICFWCVCVCVRARARACVTTDTVRYGGSWDDKPTTRGFSAWPS